MNLNGSPSDLTFGQIVYFSQIALYPIVTLDIWKECTRTYHYIPLSLQTFGKIVLGLIIISHCHYRHLERLYQDLSLYPIVTVDIWKDCTRTYHYIHCHFRHLERLYQDLSLYPIVTIDIQKNCTRTYHYIPLSLYTLGKIVQGVIIISHCHYVKNITRVPNCHKISLSGRL